jgi:hypothetical protein
MFLSFTNEFVEGSLADPVAGSRSQVDRLQLAILYPLSDGIGMHAQERGDIFHG